MIRYLIEGVPAIEEEEKSTTETSIYGWQRLVPRRAIELVILKEFPITARIVLTFHSIFNLKASFSQTTTYTRHEGSMNVPI